MAKEQKAIAKLVDKDGITVDFWRFPIKNVDKIIGQVLEMVGKSRLGLSKDDLKNFDTFVIQTTEPNGTVIDTVFECSDVEFLDLVKEDYKDYFGYYPSEDKYDSEKWSYILSGHKGYKESKKSTKKSLKESFEYDGAIPLEELMNILTDEWQENNTNNLLFRESSHWDDSARDENKYIEISAIIDFTVPWASGFGFSNKKVQKDYDKEIESVEKHYTFEDNDDYNKMTDELNEYQPILFIIAIDLKEKIVYADVDLGNGLSDTEVARERLAENEEDFRKQIQRMIESF